MSLKSMTSHFRKLTLATTAGLLIVPVASYAKLQSPQFDNTAYVLMDYHTGEILAQKNENKSLPPASLTKMMTSYIVEERLSTGKLKEDEQILVTKDASCSIGSGQSCMYVLPNKTASAIDILRGIIVQSGNDASVAAAEHLAGNETAFADMMNEKAQELGMTNSHFVNATGMPAKEHYASALDLAKLARAIISNGGKYYGIYSEKEFTYNNITQANRNSLLQTDPNVDGLKTGHTKAAGYCLVASSEKNDMRLISVIMGAKSSKARAEQSRQLLNWGYGHFETVIKAPKGQFASKVPVAFGKQDEVEVATADNLQVLTEIKKDNNIDTILDIDSNVEAPIKKGQKLGVMTATINGKPVASVDLIATHAVEKSGIIKRMWQGVVRWIKSLF